jgi:hypothetical protein
VGINDKTPMEQDKQLAEAEFSNMKIRYYNTERKGTSCRAVLQYMVDNYATKKWFYSYELVGKTNSKGAFLSHRSPARANELVQEGLLEQRNIGRFAVYRLKREEKRQEIINYLK